MPYFRMKAERGGARAPLQSLHLAEWRSLLEGEAHGELHLQRVAHALAEEAIEVE